MIEVWNVLCTGKKEKEREEKSRRLHYIYANYSFCYVSRTELLILHPRIFCEFKFLYFISSNWPVPGSIRSVEITSHEFSCNGDLVTRNEGEGSNILFIRVRYIGVLNLAFVKAVSYLRLNREKKEGYSGKMARYNSREGGKIRGGTCTNKSRVNLCKQGAGADGVDRVSLNRTRREDARNPEELRGFS